MSYILQIINFCFSPNESMSHEKCVQPITTKMFYLNNIHYLLLVSINFEHFFK